MEAKQDLCICESRSRLRPSDWPLRLAGQAASFGPDNRLHYSGYLQPVRRAERQCLRLDGSTRNEQPDLWQNILGFAERNGLSVTPAGANA
jgi:hypothetical protein